jgi:hypothetical protein
MSIILINNQWHKWIVVDEATIQKRNSAIRYPITTPPPNNLRESQQKLLDWAIKESQKGKQ